MVTLWPIGSSKLQSTKQISSGKRERQVFIRSTKKPVTKIFGIFSTGFTEKHMVTRFLSIWDHLQHSIYRSCVELVIDASPLYIISLYMRGVSSSRPSPFFLLNLLYASYDRSKSGTPNLMQFVCKLHLTSFFFRKHILSFCVYASSMIYLNVFIHITRTYTQQKWTRCVRIVFNINTMLYFTNPLFFFFHHSNNKSKSKMRFSLITLALGLATSGKLQFVV